MYDIVRLWVRVCVLHTLTYGIKEVDKDFDMGVQRSSYVSFNINLIKC